MALKADGLFLILSDIIDEASMQLKGLGQLCHGDSARHNAACLLAGDMAMEVRAVTEDTESFLSRLNAQAE